MHDIKTANKAFKAVVREVKDSMLHIRPQSSHSHTLVTAEFDPT